MKDKEQNDSGSSSDSDSSEDDEDAYNPKFDDEFYKTLSSLKRKDPTIYEKDTKFFEDVDVDTTVEKDGESKPTKKLTVKEYEHKMLMETGGVSDAEDDATNNRPASPSYNEEQNQLKNEFKQVLAEDDSDEEGGFSGLFTKREKTKQEQVEIWFSNYSLLSYQCQIILLCEIAHDIGTRRCRARKVDRRACSVERKKHQRNLDERQTIEG